MALTDYWKKRDFRKTKEPKGGVATSPDRRRFVVHEHHASHLHYDLRLEDAGVLKSWAVPKPPTLDPSVKRLAVEVEDHPVAYAKFKGDIPEGQYGAGHVGIWDEGTFEMLKADYKGGRVEVDLHGKRLEGRFALIRMKPRGTGKQAKKQWLLIKMKDAAAKREPKAVAKPAARAAAALAKKTPAKPIKTAKLATKSARIFEVTHPDKVMFPKPGYTKADLLAFYKRIAPRLLPHLKDRPVTMERLPEGLRPGAPRFWQKNVPDHAPDWIRRAELPTEAGHSVDYAIVNDVETLLYFVNQGAITFHVWLSRLATLDRPDYVLFDLDPGTAGTEALVKVARKVRDVLKSAKFTAAVKTSGKSGLHVTVPWKGKGGYDEARAFAEATARKVCAALPELATMEIRKAKRKGRVYLDIMQNARGHHVVPPYVVRAVDDATVSTPLAWREVTPRLDPKKFDLKSAPKRSPRGA